MERPLTLEDLRDGIVQHAPPGPGASGAWLVACPEDHLLAVRWAWMECGRNRACLDAIIKVTLWLLELEGRTPVRAGKLHEYIGWVAGAVGVEWSRRQGWATVEPPLTSIFDPGESVVTPTDKMPPPKENPS